MDYKKKYLKYKNKYLNLNKQVGGSALTNAIYMNDYDRVKELLDEGISSNEPSQFNGHSPLLLAISKRSIPIFNLLLDRGANINYINGNNHSCLFIAFSYARDRYGTYEYEIIYTLFNRRVIIDYTARQNIYSGKYSGKSIFSDKIISCFEKIDQAIVGNIEYFKTEPLMIDSVRIWVNYLPEAAYQELLLWTKIRPKPEKISTLLGRSVDATNPIDHQENREKVASEGLITSNIIDFIPSKKKMLYDELVKFRL